MVIVTQFLASWEPAADVMALATAEFELKDIEMGENGTRGVEEMGGWERVGENRQRRGRRDRQTIDVSQNRESQRTR